MIIVYYCLMLISICAFQISGVFVTKYGSSAQRCTIDIARIIIIWGFFMIYQGPGHESFDYVQFIGFIGIVIGTVIFNEIYVPPLCKFHKNTKVNIAKRNSNCEEVHLLIEDHGELHSSKAGKLNYSSLSQHTSPNKSTAEGAAE